MLLELGRCEFHVLLEACQTAKSKTDCNHDEMLQNFYSIFEKSSIKRSDFLETN